MKNDGTLAKISKKWFGDGKMHFSVIGKGKIDGHRKIYTNKGKCATIS